MRIEFYPYPFILGIFLLLPALVMVRRRSHGPVYQFFFAAFWLYLLLLVGVTLFPMPIPIELGGASPRQPIAVILERVNLVPFRYAVPVVSFRSRISFELVGNVLLTMPFGFGLPLITRIRTRHYPWMAFALGLGIETSQFLASLTVGLGYRGVDITDVLLNAAGFLLGYAFFRLFAWIKKIFKI